MVKPPLSDVQGYLKAYVAKVKSDNFKEAMIEVNPYIELLENNLDRGDLRYQPEKWSINEVIQHVIDTERIFCYRMLAIARGDTQNLLGFDQDEYAKNAVITGTLVDVINDFKACRKSTISLIHSLPKNTLDKKGNANGIEVTPRILAFLMIGHANHHFEVIKEHYLNTSQSH